jgi:hypothetical protein
MALALVHLAAGIGNIILATPLLQALETLRLRTHLLLDADYDGAADLFEGWSAVERVVSGPLPQILAAADYTHLIPAIPPFYWPRFQAAYYREDRVVARPPASLFYINEQHFYMSFARRLGYRETADPLAFLPVAPRPESSSHRAGEWATAATLVLAPGCKTGEMAYKRWPYFAELATLFDDVAIVGTADDLYCADSPLHFPDHVRNFAGELSLLETAQLLASAGFVTGNDSGLSHLAAAVGTPTMMIFGPTPHRELGAFAPHVDIVRAGLPCEPCWSGEKLAACEKRIDCLRSITPAHVAARIRSLRAAKAA